MRSLFYILFLLLVPYCGWGQIITTVAGTGDSTILGDGGSAVDCGMKYPEGTALDTAGNLYIVDEANNRIRKVSTSGIITTIVGTGVAGYNGDGIDATNAEISSPRDVTVDNAGNIYVCDFYNRRLRKVDTAGKITTIAGTGGVWYNGDNIPATNANVSPSCVAIDGAGNLYIGDQTNNRLRKIDNTGIITTIAGDGTFTTYTGNGSPATAASVGPVVDILVDKKGDIFISCSSYWVVCKIDTFGIITLIAGPGGSTAEDVPATDTHLYNPGGIAIDDSDNLYICDVFHNKIRRVNTAGFIKTCVGKGTQGFSGDGGDPLLAELDRPTGVTIDKNGNLYITDWKNNRIRYVDKYKNVSVNNATTNTKSIAINPNPARNEITITAATAIENVAVINMMGQVVAAPGISGKDREVLLAIHELSAGIYFVKINGVYAGRFVKE